MPSALVFYHYFYPDDVISSLHFSDLAESLALRGWSVTAVPANRGCRNEKERYAPRENWGSVRIRRVWRPAWPQAKAWGRLLNAAWMIAAWSALAFRTMKPPDVLIVGTDPILSILVALPWKWRFPNLSIAHWCFDLHPEAEVAEGLLRPGSLLLRLLQWMLGHAYARCSVLADLGICMRNKLEQHYTTPAHAATLTPWALEEPAAALPVDIKERAIFGDSKLVLFYSGTFGRAHSYGEILGLARLLRGEPIAFAFSVRGNREEDLRKAVTPEDTNIRFMRFATADQLQSRLAAADVHIVSLRPSWNGTVVPSKFFGAIAVGRPVLFAGDPESSVARWIKQYRLGWVLTPENINSVAAELRALLDDSQWRKELFERCQRVYQEHFSKQVVMDRWQMELRETLPSARITSRTMTNPLANAGQ